MLRVRRCVGLMLLLGAACASRAEAGEFVGLDPYNRQVYAEDRLIPVVPSRITGPVFRRNPGRMGGPVVSGPLYYAEPDPAVGGLYREDPLVASGAILAFDLDAALANAESGQGLSQGVHSRGPAPFTGEWYRYCEARYRSFERDSGTFQPSSGKRRLCR